MLLKYFKRYTRSGYHHNKPRKISNNLLGTLNLRVQSHPNNLFIHAFSYGLNSKKTGYFLNRFLYKGLRLNILQNSLWYLSSGRLGCRHSLKRSAATVEQVIELVFDIFLENRRKKNKRFKYLNFLLVPPNKRFK